MAQFPEIKKSIQNYLYEEEGNITRNKLLMVGSLAVVMSVLFALDAEAGHRSHSSHSSHRSSSHGSGHGSHVSHPSHQSGSGHSSHGSSHGSHSSGSHSSGSTAHSSAAHNNTSAAATTPTYPEVLIPQQTHDTPAMGTLPVPAIPALPDTASVSTNGIATSVAIDDGIGQI